MVVPPWLWNPPIGIFTNPRPHSAGLQLVPKGTGQVILAERALDLEPTAARAGRTSAAKSGKWSLEGENPLENQWKSLNQWLNQWEKSSIFQQARFGDWFWLCCDLLKSSSQWASNHSATEIAQLRLAKDVISYNSVLAACAKASSWQQALATLGVAFFFFFCVALWDDWDDWPLLLDENDFWPRNYLDRCKTVLSPIWFFLPSPYTSWVILWFQSMLVHLTSLSRSWQTQQRWDRLRYIGSESVQNDSIVTWCRTTHTHTIANVLWQYLATAVARYLRFGMFTGS